HQQTAARRVSETQLSATSAKLRETTASLSVVTDEREQAVASALAQAERAEKLAKKLAIFQQQRDQAEADLAQFRAAGMEPDQIVYAARELKKLHGALSAAETQITVLERKIRTLQPTNEGTEILLPAELKATVKSFDPKWGFLILDAGSDQGIIKNAELLLSRDSKLVAKVK